MLVNQELPALLAAWNQRAASIRAVYDESKCCPPDPASLTAMARAFRRWGRPRPGDHRVRLLELVVPVGVWTSRSSVAGGAYPEPGCL